MFQTEIFKTSASLKKDEENFGVLKSKKKSIWEDILKQMKQHGYLYCASKYEAKCKIVKQKYIKTVDHNDNDVNDFKTCTFLTNLIKPLHETHR